MSLMRTASFISLTLAIWFIPAEGVADTIVLNENFEGIIGGSYFTGTTVSHFKLESGAVEVLAAGNESGRCTGAGGSPTCINLAALPNTTFVSTAAFGPGTYDLFFDLAGSHQGQTSDTTGLYFGNLINYPIALAPGDGFSTQSILGITVGPGLLTPLTFFDTGVNGAGNLLDNVRLIQRASVPEPTTITLVVAGLVGLIATRKKSR